MPSCLRPAFLSTLLTALHPLKHPRLLGVPGSLTVGRASSVKPDDEGLLRERIFTLALVRGPVGDSLKGTLGSASRLLFPFDKWVKDSGSTFILGLGPRAWGVAYGSRLQSGLSQTEEPLETPAVVTGKEPEVLLGKLASFYRLALHAHSPYAPRGKVREARDSWAASPWGCRSSVFIAVSRRPSWVG